jgi:branched-chain amino acid transport system substrate-binding protein
MTSLPPLALILALLFSSSSIANAAVGTLGVSNNKIVFGMSNALSGPTAQLGIELKQGALAYFKRINQQGGIHGRQIEVISLDDGYEPVYTVNNTHNLIKDEQVFALFGYVGTPTSFAVLPLIEQNDIPFLMPFTGAEFLRNPVANNIFNLRASYYQEAKAQIDHLVQDLKITKIGLLIQADEFGLAVEQGLVLALQTHGLKPTVTTRYRRNTEDIANALARLKQKQVKAVSFVGTYQPFSELINLSYQQMFEPVFATVSFVSSSNLYQRLKYPSKVFVTEVVPEPNTCITSICMAFKQDMQRGSSEVLTRVQFEGYLNAYVVTEAAKLCATDLTRACLVAKLANLSLNLPDLPIHFSPQKHQGLDKIYFSFYPTQ